ncbi:MAG: rhodanese-like domain-containing protein [Pseudomonadota bacterium]
MNQVIIDVREEDEFSAEHIPDSINIPLSSFASMAPGILNQLGERNILIMCRSGARAVQAHSMAKGLGFNDAHTYQVYEGGIIRWKKEGQPVVSRKVRAPLPLMRQVQLVVGTLTLMFAVLAVTIDPRFAYGAVFTGAGLLLAGMTGFCPLANLLAKLPWNRADALAKREMCQLSKG